jgi:hypothetical protein
MLRMAAVSMIRLINQTVYQTFFSFYTSNTLIQLSFVHSFAHHNPTSSYSSSSFPSPQISLYPYILLYSSGFVCLVSSLSFLSGVPRRGSRIPSTKLYMSLALMY